MSNKYKTCILYDSLYCTGGAEKTTLVLAKTFQDSKICVDFINRSDFKDIGRKNIIELGSQTTSPPLKAIKGISNFKRKTKFLKDYDLVIYSGSYAPCAVQNQLTGKRILYCHTIPRFAYDLYCYYLKSMNPILRPFFKQLVAHTRKNYERAFSQMDVVIANSQNVRSRIQNFLKSEAVVINPPVDTSAFSWIAQKDYYLSTARLEKYKRVDTIVSAFKTMPDKKLIVASGGSELNSLKKLAENAPNITFTGWTTHNELKQLVGNAIATIYLPKNEDFGMSPVESMAAGKPVIGAKEGGLLETVLHDKTGLLITPETTAIVQAVKTLTPEAALKMRMSCEERAGLFSIKNFISRIKEVAAYNR